MKKIKIGKNKYLVDKLPNDVKEELEKIEQEKQSLLKQIDKNKNIQPEKSGFIDWFNWLWR